MSSALFHAVYASVVFVVCYVLITTERFNKTKIALAGATLMFFLPLINSDDVFYSRDTGVNWDVLFLLLGMMIIVSVVRQTGAFEYVAIWSAKRAKGSPLRIMILLILVTALGTAVLDNVTTVLLIAPVTLLVCDRLAVNPAPFLVVEAIAANIAGAATLVGDPTSIIIGTGAHLSFIEFSANMAPAVLLVLVALIAHAAAAATRASSSSIRSGSPTSCRWTNAKRSAIRSCSCNAGSSWRWCSPDSSCTSRSTWSRRWWRWPAPAS